jgi:hypothetical protein
MSIRRWLVVTCRWDEARLDDQEFDKHNHFAEAASAMKLSKKYVKSVSDAKKSVTDSRKQ